MTVSLTVTLLVDEVKATVEGLKLQVLCGGKFAHKLGVRVVEPVKPVCAVKVSDVEPDCPGLATTMVVGFAAMANPPTVTEIAGEVEP